MKLIRSTLKTNTSVRVVRGIFGRFATCRRENQITNWTIQNKASGKVNVGAQLGSILL